jgi:hypothetical protein
MWQEYFMVKGIHPGRVVTHWHGTLDFSRADIPVATIKELYEQGFPYLTLTEKGEAELYTQRKEKDSEMVTYPVAEQIKETPKPKVKKKNQSNSDK